MSKIIIHFDQIRSVKELGTVKRYQISNVKMKELLRSGKKCIVSYKEGGERYREFNTHLDIRGI